MIRPLNIDVSIFFVDIPEYVSTTAYLKRSISPDLIMVYRGKRLATTGLRKLHERCRELRNAKWLNEGGRRIEDWENEAHAGRWRKF